MRTITAVKESSERVVAAGRERLRARKRDRHRDSLLGELGQACLDERSGSTVGDVDANINRLVARLLLLNDPEDGDDDRSEVGSNEFEMAQSAHEGHGS
jgi:hypothetical protein